jgi:tetratricopeptide (TPR) repeat protein
MTTSEEIDTIFEEVAQLLSDEACSESESEKRNIIQLGLDKASRLLEIAPDYYNTYHLLGLLWYHHPDRDSKRSRRIKTFLIRAVELAPQESQFSVQYLGYIHFDEADYTEALKWFEQTDEDYFERDDKRWRWLKARELALVCRGRIRRRVDLQEARSLASEYVRAEQED